jgi:hypothetical protein
MSILGVFNRDGSISSTDVKNKMICRQLVSVKKLACDNYVRLNVGSNEPTALLYWKEWDRSEIMSVINLKVRLYAHQYERVGKQ